MASKSIDIIISTVFKKTGIDKAITQIKELGKSVGRNMANIKAGFDLAAGGISKFISAMSKGMEFERMTTQFKALTGSMETAKAHMKDLQDLGRTPPFSLEQFAAASQAMMKMTGGMAGFKKEMEIVGDMAAATGNDIATVGRAFGLAYQVIRDGQDFGRAGQQLYSLGIMTKQQVADFSELSKAGADNMELWKQLTEVFGRYKGAMADTEKTTKGMIEAIQGEATVAMTEFSSAISDSAKPALEGLLGWMQKINKDGSIEAWADSAVYALNGVASTAGKVGDAISWVWKMLMTIGAKPAALKAGLEAADELGLKGNDREVYARKFQRDVVDEIWGRNAETNADNESAKDAYSKNKAKKEAARQAKLEAEAKKRIEEDMARGKEESERRAAEKAAEEQLKAEEKAIAEEQKLREKMEKELHAQRVADINAEANIAKANMDATNRTISAAQSEFDKAFAMYRSEDKGAAQIAEERDYAADYKQLQKDAMRYGGKWRIDELSSLMSAGDTQGQAAKLEEWRKSRSFTPEVESMVRAAAADQTKTTAEDELRKIEQNTSDLAQKLDELLSMKG